MLTIGDFARLGQVSPRMLRHYDEIGLQGQARLRRVEAHLNALERSDSVDVQDIVVKHTQPIRIAEAVGTAVGFGNENLGPVFAELLPEVLGELGRAGVRPGMSVAHYEEYAEDGTVVLHAGFEIGDQPFAGGEKVKAVELPVIRVASVVHRGSMANIVPTYEALVRWIDDSGYVMTGRSRELYHEWYEEDLTRNVTELQLPIAV